MGQRVIADNWSLRALSQLFTQGLDPTDNLGVAPRLGNGAFLGPCRGPTIQNSYWSSDRTPMARSKPYPRWTCASCAVP